MADPRFFIDPDDALPADEVGAECVLPLSDDDLHHLYHVLRAEVGENIEVVRRMEWQVRVFQLTAVGADGVTGRLVRAEVLQQPAYTLDLLFGYAKGDKNETIVRQATELGVDHLYPTLFARSVARPDARKREAKTARLRGVATAAARQSHRVSPPDIAAIMTFARFFSRSPFDRGLYDLILVPWEEEAARPLSTTIADIPLPQNPRVLLVIGPEGGITTDEIVLLRDAGAVTCSLGATILRVDTACAAACAIVADALAARCGTVDAR
ncbi:MAG: 16S rRNA (uracil(1498)-N(3))-methyltransferase [Actinomycetes bacterium]|jgi:16S rRNA (uracil1498-N3)-methyltransferase|nr:16S rRNA (uracil(1498)-N(3))-methyltransferase [Actinomycetes bacterium]